MNEQSQQCVILGRDYDMPPQVCTDDGLKNPDDFLMIGYGGQVYCIREIWMRKDRDMDDRLPRWVIEREASYQEWKEVRAAHTLYEALGLVVADAEDLFLSGLSGGKVEETPEVDLAKYQRQGGKPLDIPPTWEEAERAFIQNKMDEANGYE